MFDKTNATNEILHTVQLKGLGPHVDVRSLHGIVHVGKRNLVRPHRVRIDVNLIFPNEAAHRSNITDTLSRKQSVPNIPVLNRPQLLQVPSARRTAVRITPFQRVPEDLAQGRRVRAQSRLYPLRERARR